MNKKDLKYYLGLNWTYVFEWSDDDGGYVASVSELKGCKSFGETLEEAAEMIKDALNCHLSAMLEAKMQIPEPVKKENYKGVITLRTTPDIHFEIAKYAKRIGTSINAFINEALNEKLKELKT